MNADPSRPPRVLIIGATSAIAEAVARVYAQRGAQLVLLARTPQRLAAIAGDLQVRGARQVRTLAFDAAQTQAQAALLEQAWSLFDGVDIALIAHGTLSDQAACQRSLELQAQEFQINALSVIGLCALLANRLEQQGGGTLAVISSVAGDRGRASNYVYGAAKAAVSAYLSGLRQRLWSQGVHVLTVKPGFVDTPMTAAFRKGPLWASPGTVARDIVRAIERRRPVLYTPFFWWGIMALIRLIPERLFRRIRL